MQIIYAGHAEHQGGIDIVPLEQFAIIGIKIRYIVSLAP